MATRLFKIKKGLDVPLTGEPEQSIDQGSPPRTVAVVGPDYVGMKPTMAVQVGDRVKIGQVLFSDKKTTGVNFTSPAGGVVKEINRGAKRAFLSMVIEVDAEEEEISFKDGCDGGIEGFLRDQIVKKLTDSGLWTSLRARPYGKIPPSDSEPHAIFVTAIDTNPLAASPEVVIAGAETAFQNGLRILRKLTTGKTFVCTARGSTIPVVVEEEVDEEDDETLEVIEFEGPHPAGLVGTHINFLHPVTQSKTVWYIGYQDVMAIGKLFATGSIPLERVVSIAGPGVQSPRLLRTRRGANLDDLTRNELGNNGKIRMISGSVLWGRKAAGPLAYLGRYHNQVTAIYENEVREFLGWMSPGLNKFSVKPAFLSWFFSGGFALNTDINGSPRAMVPIGMYEKVMPLDVQPTFLLRALLVKDTDQAQALGCLDLEEEDLGLCTFVCPGKHDFGDILRENLTLIEKDG